MVKKKRQNGPQEDDSSTESGEDKTTSTVGQSPIDCAHINKAVDPTRVKKVLKASGLETERCLECAKGSGTEEPADDSKNIDMFEYDKTLWLCLKCGTQLCGRWKNKHALQHFNTLRSESHALALNTTTFDVWCYICDNQINPSIRKKVLECVEFVKKITQQPVAGENRDIDNIEDKVLAAFDNLRPLLSEPLNLSSEAKNSTAEKKDGNASGSVLALPAISGLATTIQTIENLPKVRGLANLGNTCFFNAVLQCLAQTPYLLEVLREASEPGEEFILPGGEITFKNGESAILPPIKGNLSSWGGLTSALAETLEELQSGGGIFVPRKIFGKLTAKLPQFRGGDQHDSHELLRHLLESVRSEDLQRYQKVILSSLEYKGQDINSVDDEMKQKCKKYGEQAADRILRPEPVFRGFLVSTLTCQDCYNTSSRHEYFLDLSLPVSVEKPQPPTRRRGSPELISTPGTSKHQLKKEKEKERKAKRAAKHHTKVSTTGQTSTAAAKIDGDSDAIMSTGNEKNSTNSRSSSSTEQSDADVEDNLLDDLPRQGSTVDNGQLINKSIPPLYDPNGNSEILTMPGDLEKRGDVTTSPANMLMLDNTDNRILPRNRFLPTDPNIATKNLSVSEGNFVFERGLSREGATLVKQWSQPEGAENNHAASIEGATVYGSPADELENLYLKDSSDKPTELIAQKTKGKRMRTVSYSDWSTTMGPRYQCEDGECSIQSCIHNFTTVELMTGNNKVGCDACTRAYNGENGKTINTNATKQFLISSPPAVLILHLKRFQIGPRCMFQKLKRHVTFPLVLDLAPFCGSKVKTLPNIDRKQKKLIYALYGIVEHSGGMHGGHYTAYVKVRPKITTDDPRWKFIPQGSKAELDQADEQRAKLDELAAKKIARELRLKENDSDDCTSSNSSNFSDSNDHPEEEGAVGGSADAPLNIVPPPGKWYYVSDSYVEDVSEARVLKSEAYLLFYERIY